MHKGHWDIFQRFKLRNEICVVKMNDWNSFSYNRILGWNQVTYLVNLVSNRKYKFNNSLISGLTQAVNERNHKNVLFL